jgi:CheY-like chemotaxis protein
VRELVELHGGTVIAESAGFDLGATFTVILPIAALLLLPLEETENEPRPPSVVPALLAPPSNMLDGTKVLVVDDEVDARDALVGLLERYGAEVRPAASVSEAMAALETDLPDVLISDIGMPGEDGYELIRRVRLLPAEAGGGVPSLAVSAYATDEHRRKK